MADEVKLTREGYVRQQALLERERIRLEDIARSLGENTDYDDDEADSSLEDIKREKAQLELHIQELEDTLSRAMILNAGEHGEHSDQADLGAVVVLRDTQSRREMRGVLVSALEASTVGDGLRQISDDSPVGKALQGKKVGESFVVQLPKGPTTYELVSLEW